MLWRIVIISMAIWILGATYLLWFSPSAKQYVVSTGYYRIEYKSGNATAYFVDTARKREDQVTIDEVEKASGLKFPRYEVKK